MNNALFEIGVEELPISEMRSILEQLEKNIGEILKNNRLSCKNYKIFIAPRRISFILYDLPNRQADTVLEKKGPPIKIALDEEGKPTKALLGFLRSNKANLEDIEKRGNYVYLVKKIEGKNLEAVLPKVFEEIVNSLSFKKPMRWGKGLFEFVRPVHWLVALLNDKVLNIEIFGVKSSNISRGHRFHSGNVKIKSVETYIDQLREAFVLVDHKEREDLILEELKKIGGDLEEDRELIEEIVWMTEYPSPILGSFNEEYLTLPEEIITVTIKHHQKAFTLKENGKIKNMFLAFMDGPSNFKENIRKGYEKVVNARLEDARYYYLKDLEKSLEARNEELKGIVFQKDLGTLYDKVLRIKSLSKILCDEIKVSEEYKFKVLRAAILSKADIATKIVFEFPELQGVIGRIYAIKQGEDEEVAWAIQEQYEDEPENMIGAIIGLADRIDTITGNVLIENLPTGSKDPFGLRKKMDAVFKILRKYEWDLDLEKLFRNSKELIGMDKKGFWKDLEEFARGRFYAFLVNTIGIPYDVARSVNHLWVKPLRGILSAEAIYEILNSKDFQDLVVGFERVHNITKKHESKIYDGALFQIEAEKKLLNKFLEVKDKVKKALDHLNYKEAVRHLLELKPFIDSYFDNVFVMVNQEDIRLNRLGFLKNIDDLFMEIGDLSHLVKRQ